MFIGSANGAIACLGSHGFRINATNVLLRCIVEQYLAQKFSGDLKFKLNGFFETFRFGRCA